MKSYYSRDLGEGMSLDGEIFALQDFQRKKSQSGNPYYSLVLQDKTGDVIARVWENKIPNCKISNDTIGGVVKIDGTVQMFNGKPQIIVNSCQETDDYEMSDLIQISEIGIDELYEKIQAHIKTIKDPDLTALFENLFGDEDFLRKFKESPAAEKVHHDFVGGLMEHVIELLDLADTIVSLYPTANLDLVKAGLLLHDIGKIVELERVGTTFVRTKMGRLIGHLPISVEIAKDHLPEDFPEELWMHLWHIILSHHGLLEYGSPVVPKTIEAAMVHHIDYMSSHIRQYQKQLDLTDEGQEFTNYVRTLGTDIYAIPYGAESKETGDSSKEEDLSEEVGGGMISHPDPDQVSLF